MSELTRLDALTWRADTLAVFWALRAELDARLGAPALVDLDSNGVGCFDAYLARCPCGLELALWRFHLTAGLRRIDDTREPARVELDASEPDADHPAFHAGIAATRLHRMAPARTAGWVVWRRDDIGNRVEVTRATSRCEAEGVAHGFEDRGHKPLYWVEPAA